MYRRPAESFKYGSFNAHVPQRTAKDSLKRQNTHAARAASKRHAVRAQIVVFHTKYADL